MILEIAHIRIRPEAAEQFEAALAQAPALFESSKGCLGIEFRRSIENTGKYILLARWETLENHMVDFRESEAFKAWRALITPYVAAPLEMENTTAVALK